MSPLSPRALVVYCGLLLTLGSFSVDITLPFFRAMREAFGSTDAAVQATVTLYVGCIGIGQLIFGPLSDRFGRRPAIAVGLGIYLLGALISLLAGSIEQMLLGRAIQGVGAAAGPVVSRAILRDLFNGRQLAQNMALATGIFSLGPILAPLIGVAFAQAGGTWRSVFAGMLGLALLMLAGLWRAPETLSARRPDALRLASLLAQTRALLAHPQSRHFLLLGPIAQSSMLSIVAGMPRVFEREYGVTGALFAVLFALHGFGIIIGQTANHRLIVRLGAARTALMAALIMLAASALIAGFAALHWLTPYRFAFFVFVFAIGYLIVMANAASMTLDPHPGMAGFTSSFLGFSTQVPGAMLAMTAVTLSAGRAVGLGLALCVLCSVCCTGLVWWLRGDASRLARI